MRSSDWSSDVCSSDLVVRVVERRVGAVDRLHRVARAAVRERGAAAGAVVEVDRLDHGIVHGAGAAALGHVEVAVVGAVLVLAGLLVADGAGADLRVLQVVVLPEDTAAGRVDDTNRACRAAAVGGVGYTRHPLNKVRGG